MEGYGIFTVRFEIRVNDYTRRFSVAYFPALSNVESWMFDQMVADTQEYMAFPNGEDFVWRFMPEIGKPEFIIHEVQNDNGIVFSDGTHTNGKRFCAGFMRKFFDECAQRQSGNYKFSEEE